MAKKIILLIFLLALLPLINAQPPFQQSTGSEVGLNLRFPPVDVIKQNTDITSHMHVFNATNDLPLTNSTVNCSVHIYNETGNHLVKQQMGYELGEMEFELKILGGNFTEQGHYSFIVWCNSSTAGGFVSGGFDVTYSGKVLSTGQAILYFTLIVVLLSFFVLIIHFKDRLPPSNARDGEGNLISKNQLKYLRSSLIVLQWVLVTAIFFLTSNLAFAYLQTEMFAKILFTFYRIMFVLIYPILIGWFIWIFVSIFVDRKFKRLMEKGLEMGEGF